MLYTLEERLLQYELAKRGDRLYTQEDVDNLLKEELGLSDEEIALAKNSSQKTTMRTNVMEQMRRAIYVYPECVELTFS